jgi:hypothetical protein
LTPSRWTTGNFQAVGQYYQIDFGGYVMVDSVNITSAYLNDGKGDFAPGLDVAISTDGSDFSRVLGSATTASDPGVITISFPAHAAKVLRLVVTQATTTSWWTIHEIDVGCTIPNGPGVTPPDMSLPSPGAADPGKNKWAAAASSTNGSDVAANAYDGNTGTRWADGKTPQYGDEWYMLDLGQPYTISQVWLTSANGDYPVAYALDVSTDNVTWKNVSSGLGADVTKIWLPPQSARYVRVRQIGSGYDHWWGIQEINVYQ